MRNPKRIEQVFKIHCLISMILTMAGIYVNVIKSITLLYKTALSSGKQ